jgi:hypothetical protein
MMIIKLYKSREIKKLVVRMNYWVISWLFKQNKKENKKENKIEN